MMQLEQPNINVQSFNDIERFTFALFYSCMAQTTITSRSQLIQDERYSEHQLSNGSISYHAWEQASYARYRASR